MRRDLVNIIVPIIEDSIFTSRLEDPIIRSESLQGVALRICFLHLDDVEEPAVEEAARAPPSFS
jgi:hypothetical protein